jgi:hypothetical protein
VEKWWAVHRKRFQDPEKGVQGLGGETKVPGCVVLYMAPEAREVAVVVILEARTMKCGRPSTHTAEEAHPGEGEKVLHTLCVELGERLVECLGAVHGVALEVDLLGGEYNTASRENSLLVCPTTGGQLGIDDGVG